MRSSKLKILACAVVYFAFAYPASPAEPENVALAVQRVTKYHDSGAYQHAMQAVVNSAERYLHSRVQHKHATDKYAAVFDIDETSLTNWETLSKCGFCSYQTQLQFYPQSSHDPAIAPVLGLFHYAQKEGVSVFFVTGRPEGQRDLTVANLTEAGYADWTDLVMRPADNKDPAGVFKPAARKQIQDKGYTIVLNIGDQASDLSGCCAQRGFKLPNPFYLVP